jgi:arylsulfatase
MLPIGQQLWLKHLESYIPYPPLQEAESYNLSQVIAQVKAAQSASHAGE